MDIGVALTWRQSDLNKIRGTTGDVYTGTYTCTTIQFWRQSFRVIID